MNQEEIWESIDGWDGYLISTEGRVKTLSRTINTPIGVRYVKEKIRNGIVGKRGYVTITLCVNGKQKTVPVHRLVAKAFIPNPENKIDVDHIDGDSTNNHVDNLRWATRKENLNNPITSKRKIESGVYKEASVKALTTRKAKNQKYAPKIVYSYTKDGDYVKSYNSIGEAARCFRVDPKSIHHALNDEHVLVGGFLWSDKIINGFRYIERDYKSKRPILQFDKDGNLIREWNSIHDASQALGISDKNIYRSIRVNNGKPKKYKFKFKE